MTMSTFSGPMRVGSTKETTGTTADTTVNTGCVVVAQNKAVAYANTGAQTFACVVPAGSLITGAQFIATTAYTTTAPTFTMFVNGVQVSAAGTAALVGAANIPLGTNSAAGAALVANVGPVNATIAFTQANGGGGTGAGQLVITYVVRNADGSQVPASA